MTREEAINEIKSWVIPSKNGREVLETLIPELAESEDERIRKGLIDIFNSALGQDFLQRKAGLDRDKVIAYLEKQKKIIDSITASRITIRPDGGIERHTIGYLEKQKEQPISAEEVLAKAGLKPYKDGNQWCILAGDNIQDGICGFGDTIEDALYQFLMEVLEKQKEQKPAEWSEEDETHKNFILESLEDQIRFCKKNAEGAYYAMQIRTAQNWLKSLRPSWKPNELEKGALRTAIHLMTEERNFPKAAEQLQNILNVFEGKESRHDWKPSKEEMEALDVACSGKLWYGEIYLEGLKRIREQLKKL